MAVGVLPLLLRITECPAIFALKLSQDSCNRIVNSVARSVCSTLLLVSASQHPAHMQSGTDNQLHGCTLYNVS